MVKVIIEPARNGIVKRVVEDNHGGSLTASNTVDVYEIDDTAEDKYKNIIRFFHEMMEDLGVSAGSDFSDQQIRVDVGWGSKYTPTDEEIDKRIKTLKLEIKLLESCKKS